MMSSSEAKTDTDVVFSWHDLRRELARCLEWDQVYSSTLHNWVNAVLDVPRYNPRQPRLYSWDEFQALLCWARAGELARFGKRSTRAQRRKNIYLELMKNGSKGSEFSGAHSNAQNAQG